MSNGTNKGPSSLTDLAAERAKRCRVLKSTLQRVYYIQKVLNEGKDKNSLAFGSKVKGVKLMSGREVLEVLDK